MFRFFRHLRFWIRSRRLADELREEIETHRSLREAALEREGVADAAAASRRALGNEALAREEARQEWLWPRLDETQQDLRYAIRTLRSSPGFTAVAVLTVALGVGANTAVFTVLYATLLKPLPFANPDELVAVSMQIPELRTQFASLPLRAVDFEEFRRSNNVFTGMAAVRERDFILSTGAAPERLYGARVSASLFSMLGVGPRLGRDFLPEEDAPGRDSVILISHELWTTRFGADPRIVNRALLLDGQPHVVVGVMPAGLLFPTGRQLHTHVELGPRIDVWKPMAFTEGELSADQLYFSWGVIARLKPGMSHRAAQTHLDAIAQDIGKRLQARVPSLGDFDFRTHFKPLREVFSGEARDALVTLMGAVGVLLAIACVNVVNLLLARVSSRSTEFATRAALGAHRARLARQLLTETLLLTVPGGAAGLALAAWGMPLLTSLAPMLLMEGQKPEIGLPVLLFVTTVVLGVAATVGMVPAMEMARRDLHNPIAAGGRATDTHRGGRLRRGLVAAEVALCTALLAIAALLFRSFLNLSSVDPGFEAERVLSLDIAIPEDRYTGSQAVAFYQELLDSIRGLPGVLSAGAISILPLTSQSEGNAVGVYLESDTEQRLDRPVPHYRVVTGGYFETMGIWLLAGRYFDTPEPASAAVVSEELGRRLWPGAAPQEIVGRRIRIGEVTDTPVPIVGIVDDIRAAAMERQPTPTIYVPHVRNRVRDMSVVIRTAIPPETLAASIRAEVWKRDRSVPIPAMRTMRDVVSASLARRRFQMFMVTLFAGTALALALVGVYGVTSYAVARQTRDVGVRIALGAQPGALLRSVLFQGLRPVAAGLLIGLPIAVGVATVARSVLFETEPTDPAILASISIALLVTAAIACYLPARRAARIDPVVALRTE